MEIFRYWKWSFATMKNGDEEKRFEGFRDVNELFYMH